MSFGMKRIDNVWPIVEGRDYGQLKDLISDQDGCRITSENVCQKPAGNSRRLKKMNF